MLDVDALERRWLKYKLKQFLPYLFYPLVVVAVGIGGVFLVKTVQFSPSVGVPTIALKVLKRVRHTIQHLPQWSIMRT